MFFAKISRGRTVRQFIHGTLSAPVCYIFLYLVIFAGAGIDMERLAAEKDLCCSDTNEGFFKSPKNLVRTINISSVLQKLYFPYLFSNCQTAAAKGANVDRDKPMDLSMRTWLCGEEHSGVSECNKCATKTLGRYVGDNKTFGEFADDRQEQGGTFGAKDREITRVSCRNPQEVKR